MSAEARPRQPLDRGVGIAALAAILLLAAGLRLQGLRWDAACPPPTATGASCTETHLHPDERFLTMVAAAIEFPDSLSAYFDTKSSPTNPHNRGHGFFAYGLFPVLAVKAVAAPLGLAGYDQVHLVGRVVSALCDLLSIGLLFVLARRLYDPVIGLLAALLLALAVLPIQQAHFFTSDSMATAASTLALLCAVGIARRGRWRDFLYFGLALGLAVAIKVSVASLAVLAVAAVWARARHRRWLPSASPAQREPLLAGLVLAAVVASMVFRLLNPYAFAGPGALGLGLNPSWLANMKEVGELMGGWRDFPPGHQWTDRAALWFPWQNMVLVGLGPALGLAAWIGWAAAGVLMFRRRHLHHLLPWLWVAVLFAHQGSQWVKSLRYLLPIYPVLALFAALLLVGVWRRAQRRAQRSGRRFARLAAAALAGSVIIGTLAWAWAFTAIYRRPHSRVEASRWIYQNFPAGSAIAHETWDDPLPVALDGLPGMGQYRGLALHPYAEDSPEKLEEMLQTLDQVDLLVVSSNRVYDSVARLPQRFPMTVRYYEALFSGALGFERVAEFTSYPRLFGVSIPDQGVEEAFSVYDHPRVQLFARSERWSVAAARDLLDLGDWSGVLQLTPREAARYRDLNLPPARLALQQQGGTWMLPESGGRAGADPGRFPPTRGAKVSLLLWILCLQWLGLIAFPLAAPALRGLPDRGWLLSKTIGLLILAYLGWLAGSLGWLRFGPSTVRWLALLLTLAALAAVWRGRRDLADFARRRWRLLLAEEVLFWGFFAFMLWLRYRNPDLWHPSRGGEKPMDLAYFNAVVRSTVFPPYDPWFAGGALNYYYFGFVLAGSLSLLSRVPTAIAYNLAIPTFFALTAAGAASAAGALAAGSALPRQRLRSLGWGLAGAVAVVVAGNQGVPRLFAEALARLSKVELPSRIPLLPELVRLLDGAARWISGAALGIQDHWLYWAPSRSIPHPPTEPSPITEFPLFTFLFGDLHAHMMAMPVTLLSIAVLASLVMRAPPPAPRHWQAEPRILEEVSGLALLALAVGALAAINTWDWPTLLGLTGLALLIRELQRDRPARAPLRAAWRFGLVALAGRLLYLPFHHHFVPAYGRVEPWQGSRTPLPAFLAIHALFLLPIVAWLLLERRPWQATARARARSGGLDRILEYWGLGLATLLIVLGFPLEALLIAVIALAAGYALTPGRGGGERLAAAFVLTGATLALAVEHLVLAGDVGRMNTVFKTYLQIWILWGLASTYALAALSRAWRGMEPADPRRAQSARWRTALIAVWSLLLAGAFSFPLLGIPARLRDRFASSTHRGLDGRAFMAEAVYGDEHGEIELRWDGEAIRWLDRHVAGSPVVLEASTPIYRWGSRISVHTGLPTVLGWDWHQQQQRAILKNDPIGHRRQEVAAMFSAPTTEEILPLLRRHRVRYVVVGQLERLYYPQAGLDKFARGAPFREVYRNPGTVIYEVAPAPLPG